MTNQNHLAVHLQKTIDDFKSSKPKSPLRKKSMKAMEDYLTVALFEENVDAVKLLLPFLEKLNLSGEQLMVCATVPASKSTERSAEIFYLMSERGIIKNPSSWLRKSVTLRNLPLAKSVMPFASQGDADEALVMASTYGLLDFVKEIAKEANPKANKSLAIQRAALYNHQDVVDFLFDKSEGAFAFRELKAHHPEAIDKDGAIHLRSLVQKEKTQKEKTKILNKISVSTPPARPRPKM